MIFTQYLGIYADIDDKILLILIQDDPLKIKAVRQLSETSLYFSKLTSKYRKRWKMMLQNIDSTDTFNCMNPDCLDFKDVKPYQDLLGYLLDEDGKYLGYYVKCHYSNMLNAACKLGYRQQAQWFHEWGGTIKKLGPTNVLSYAIERYDISMVEWLLSMDCAVSYDDLYPVMQHVSLDMFRLLVTQCEKHYKSYRCLECLGYVKCGDRGKNAICIKWVGPVERRRCFKCNGLPGLAKIVSLAASFGRSNLVLWLLDNVSGISKTLILDMLVKLEKHEDIHTVCKFFQSLPVDRINMEDLTESYSKSLST